MILRVVVFALLFSASCKRRIDTLPGTPEEHAARTAHQFEVLDGEIQVASFDEEPGLVLYTGPQTTSVRNSYMRGIVHFHAKAAFEVNMCVRHQKTFTDFLACVKRLGLTVNGKPL